MVDKNNLLAQWFNYKFMGGDVSAGKLLLSWTTPFKGISEKPNFPAVIKIPTAKLDTSKLRIRNFAKALEEGPNNMENLTKGFPISQLSAHSNYPVEYVYQGEIPVNIFDSYKYSQMGELTDSPGIFKKIALDLLS